MCGPAGLGADPEKALCSMQCVRAGAHEKTLLIIKENFSGRLFFRRFFSRFKII
jgi:hypothetical protein